ncbi:hypothetical protein [Burkholderia lata]|uniref:hypothetical protein n=1 Tax=Burkholderia lata (strain ATCC 17760 / DSM 23089 / LMG 22485 / NCIMB 9086 / R18194 / 383) TaxID=482957 RepID=UPI00399B2572
MSKNDERPHNQPGPNPHDFVDRSRGEVVRVHANASVGIACRFIVTASNIVCPLNRVEAERPSPECLALKTQTTPISIRQVLHRHRDTHESDSAYAHTPNGLSGDLRTWFRTSQAMK